MTNAAFFDLDCCLVDSRAAIAGAINHALRTLDLPGQPDSGLYHLIGPPLLDSFQELLPALGGDAADARQAVEIYRTVYPDLSVSLTTTTPGMGQVLDDLQDRIMLAVVTSKPRPLAISILYSLGLDSRFLAVFGPELDALSEPKAVQLALAVAAAGGVADRTTMIGDRRHDIEAARAVGTRSIGVTWGTGDHAELVLAGADHVVDDPARLVPLLLG